MRIHWWKSIRWHLALGSVCVVLVATLLLALTALFAVRYYYIDEQQSRLEILARDKAQSLGTDYAYALSSLEAKSGLSVASAAMQNNAWTTALNKVKASSTQLDNQGKTNANIYVLNSSKRLLYPATEPRSMSAATIVNLLNSSYTNIDRLKLSQAIQSALHGNAKLGQLGHRLPQDNTQPFCAFPIYYDGQVGQGPPIGVVVTAESSTASLSFVSTVGVAVTIATLVIVLLAAAASIAFARTITRPLVRLTEASRVVANGDYSAQVSTEAPGEIGELAHSFNEMATQLKRDVDELHKQEQWRRELIMNITHDLATPLTAIAGLGEALVDGIGQTRDDYEATGRIIMAETLRLRRLVQDLHVMAKVEAGALTPKKTLIRLAPLVDQVFATMITEFERYHVEPVNDIPFDLPFVSADPDMLTRVLANLYSNALRHSPAGGTLTVSVTSATDTNAVIITVSDTGEGIPEAALPRIFERFYRADNARQSAMGGSGLGLSIVQAIVEAHGGKIWAANNPAGGASISFLLPLPASTEDHSSTIPGTPTIPLLPEGAL